MITLRITGFTDALAASASLSPPDAFEVTEENYNKMRLTQRAKSYPSWQQDDPPTKLYGYPLTILKEQK